MFASPASIVSASQRRRPRRDVRERSREQDTAPRVPLVPSVSTVRVRPKLRHGRRGLAGREGRVRLVEALVLRGRRRVAELVERATGEGIRGEIRATDHVAFGSRGGGLARAVVPRLRTLDAHEQDALGNVGGRRTRHWLSRCRRRGLPDGVRSDILEARRAWFETTTRATAQYR